MSITDIIKINRNDISIVIKNQRLSKNKIAYKK